MLSLVSRGADFLKGEAGRYAFYKSKGIPKAFPRFWRQRILKSVGIPQVSSIFICPSHDCNADCVHCYEKFLHDKLKESLTTQDVKSVIDQFRDLGGHSVTFCSGEFLLRKDAIELLHYAKANSMLITLVSNGMVLDDKKLDEVKSAGVARLCVSIDSPDPKRHDELRRVKGCFDGAVRALRAAKAKGIETSIWTYVTKTNRNELAGIEDLGARLGVTMAFVYFPLLSGHLFEKYEENLSYEERESLRRKYNGSKVVTLEFPDECATCRGGGQSHIAVMPSGDVTFCPPVPYSYGNIRETPMKVALGKILKDYQKFCTSKCTGQCIVNFPEYRRNCNAKFMYAR